MPPDPKPTRRLKEPKPLTRKTPLKAYSRIRGARSGKNVTCAREGCDVLFYVKPSKIGLSKYCSKSCSVAVLAERAKMTRRGRNNPNYKTGKSVGKGDVSRVFNIRLKGESICRNCGSSDDVCLHHAIPRSIGPRESKTNLLNGLPLCRSCHSGWHQGWLIICRSVFQPDEWAYMSAVCLTGRETNAWLDRHYPVEPRVPTCARGHVLEGDNIAPNGRYRMCRRCRMERLAARR